MLKDFAVSAPEKKKNLTGFLEKGEWKDYEILAHALKSTSKTVGINEMYDRFLSLENAAKNKDFEFINNNHESAVEKYSEFANGISKVMDLR